MAKGSYKYRDFVDRGVVALNNWDFDAYLSPNDFSPNFTKYLGPQSMGVPPQKREDWYEDLTTGFVGQNFKQWHATIQQYCEDADNRCAIAWCRENGILIDGREYEMDYVMRYEFDENGKLEKLYEHTDSDLQKGIYMRWMERLEKEKEKETQKQKQKETQTQENGQKEVDTAKQNKNTDQPRQLYLITYPRSASNLLVRILSLENQPNVLSRDRGGGYFFLPFFNLGDELNNRSRHVEKWTQEERSQMMQMYQKCYDDLEEHVQRASAEGKTIFVKEHGDFMTEPTAQTRFLFGKDSVTEFPWTVKVPSTYGSELTHSALNHTALPDQFLQTWLPTFLIRHPALAFPSHYRTIIDTKGVEAARAGERDQILMMTLHWTRALYDWYTQHLSKPEPGVDSDITWPLVLEADDIMTEPEVIVRFCEIAGLDTTKLQSSWTPATEEELAKINKVGRRMFSTISASNGIVKGKTSANLDIDTEAKKWKGEFGEGEGEKIERWVRAAMPDYEFMKAKRLRPKPA
ncbi:hypothetical protein MMC30_008723 [Trapelia coarctata]|nr:hypothetical protein [Trapelia coarctata]